MNPQYMCQRTIRALPWYSLGSERNLVLPINAPFTGFSGDSWFSSHRLQVARSPEAVQFPDHSPWSSLKTPFRILGPLPLPSLLLSFPHFLAVWDLVHCCPSQHYSCLNPWWSESVPGWTLMPVPLCILNSSPLILSSARFQPLIPMVIPYALYQ